MAETPTPLSALPPLLDPRKVFKQGLQIQGNIAVSSLERLCASLLNNEGMASASMVFEVDEERRLRIRGQVSAEVSVVCQRCLQPMKQILDDSIDLVLVNSEARMKQLPAALDPWFCGEDEMLVPAAIVEEQLILAMPIVTMHQHDDHEHCIDIGKSLGSAGDASAADSALSEPAKHNPFAVLAGLKAPRDRH